MSGFSEEEKDLVMALTIVAACLSMLGALFIFVMFIAYSHLRGFAFRLILYLALSDAGSAFFILIGPARDDDGVCQFQAFGISYFNLASVIWAGVIAWTLFKAIVGQHQEVNKYEVWYVLGVNLYCLVVSVLPFATDSYGESSTGFCWLTEQGDDRATALTWQLVQFYIPLWIIVVYATYCYFRVYRAIKVLLHSVPDVEETDRRERLKSISRLRFFPIVIVVAWLFGTINRIYLFNHHDDPSLFLTIMHAVLGNLIGLMNCLVYGLNSQVKGTLRHSCSKCLPCVEAPRELEMGENYA